VAHAVPNLLTLADLAEVRHLSLKTLRTSWRERVKAGDIPAPLKGKGHPRWNPDAVARFFSGERPEKEKPGKNRRAEAATASIMALMQANQ